MKPIMREGLWDGSRVREIYELEYPPLAYCKKLFDLGWFDEIRVAPKGEGISWDNMIPVGSYDELLSFEIVTVGFRNDSIFVGVDFGRRIYLEHDFPGGAELDLFVKEMSSL